jgi:paraquat-inducible protein A
MPFVHPNSLAARTRGPDRLLGLALAAAVVLLAAGWVLPLMTVSKLLVLYDEVSILSGAARLWAGGYYVLFAVIVVFSVVFPAAKISLAGFMWLRLDLGRQGLPKALDIIDGLGRWSMLDVFVVALTVVAVEVSLVSDVAIHPGLYCFAGAVVISMATVRRMTRLARRRRELLDA